MLELNDINSKIIELYNQGLSYTNIAGNFLINWSSPSETSIGKR